jgi:hypothetical protein
MRELAAHWSQSTQRTESRCNSARCAAFRSDGDASESARGIFGRGVSAFRRLAPDAAAELSALAERLATLAPNRRIDATPRLHGGLSVLRLTARQVVATEYQSAAPHARLRSILPTFSIDDSFRLHPVLRHVYSREETRALRGTASYHFSEYHSVFERSWAFLKLVIINPVFAWRQRNEDERFGQITRISSFFIRRDGTAPLAGDHHSLGR